MESIRDPEGVREPPNNSNMIMIHQMLEQGAHGSRMRLSVLAFNISWYGVLGYPLLVGAEQLARWKWSNLMMDDA